jgi:hypothetical protein
MPSAALQKFNKSLVGARVLASYVNAPSAACGDQAVIDQCLLSAAVAQGVGCWEGYVEGAIREFVSKVRIQAHRRSWSLIAQFESIVDKMATDLNTPNWDKCRELLISVTGMDPYSGWIWTARYSNQTDTRDFFDGILLVRHSFAHGFSIPSSIKGLSSPGVLDSAYVVSALDCLQFFANTTDALLEHELLHRHSCASGWS